MRRRHAIAAILTLGTLIVAAGCGLGRRGAETPAPPRECPTYELPAAGVASCAVLLEPYIRYDDPDAWVFNDLPVKLYFFPQKPPRETQVVQPIRAKAVSPARTADACRAAGREGLVNLQKQARARGATAVVNIRATWDGEPLGDELHFGCAVLRGGERVGVVWEGTLAYLPPPVSPPRPAADVPAMREEDDRAKRLRALDDLFYKGLISKEELERRRQAILDEI